MSVPLVKRRFTVDEFYRMAEAGILSEDDRVELIDGEIVEMVPIGSHHAHSVDRLTSLLVKRADDRAVVRVQNPVRLDVYSEPQPDFALLRPRSYASGHPGPEDVFLIIEIMQTSADYDRRIKIPLYARAGIREVWLVDLPAGRIEVHRNPAATGYAEVESRGPGDRLAPLLLPALTLTVDEVFT